MRCLAVMCAMMLTTPVLAQMAPMPGMAPHAASTYVDPPSTKGYKDAMDKMMTGMEAPYSGDPDRDFVVDMIPHHQGAVDMAEIELKYGTDPKLKALARGIIAAQEKEIAFMQAWLAKHPAPAAK